MERGGEVKRGDLFGSSRSLVVWPNVPYRLRWNIIKCVNLQSGSALGQHHKKEASKRTRQLNWKKETTDQRLCTYKFDEVDSCPIESAVKWQKFERRKTTTTMRFQLRAVPTNSPFLAGGMFTTWPKGSRLLCIYTYTYTCLQKATLRPRQSGLRGGPLSTLHPVEEEPERGRLGCKRRASLIASKQNWRRRRRRRSFCLDLQKKRTCLCIWSCA